MIKNNESKVKITNRNIKYYSDKGYLCKVDDIISIDVLTMSHMSHNKVIAICKICENENEISYSKYNINFNRGGFYSCKKCSNKKRVETNIIKHGVENIFQRDDVRERNKKWMSSKEFRIKSNETQISKYDCLFVQTDEFRESNSIKTKNSIKKKKESGEYLTPLSLPSNKELREKAMYEKYGHTYSYHVDSIKDKIQKTNIEKFGHISPLGNDIIIEKIRNIFIEKYGVDNPFKNIDIQNGIKDKRKIKLKDNSEFIYYRNKIRYDTYKIKNELFDRWNGYDYYDGEYIKDYLNLYKNHNNYPSIDHKFSCFYGFINNLPTTEISNIENLCITKRIINSRKSQLNEKDFINILTGI